MDPYEILLQNFLTLRRKNQDTVAMRLKQYQNIVDKNLSIWYPGLLWFPSELGSHTCSLLPSAAQFMRQTGWLYSKSAAVPDGHLVALTSLTPWVLNRNRGCASLMASLSFKSCRIIFTLFRFYFNCFIYNGCNIIFYSFLWSFLESE